MRRSELERVRASEEGRESEKERTSDSYIGIHCRKGFAWRIACGRGKIVQRMVKLHQISFLWCDECKQERIRQKWVVSSELWVVSCKLWGEEWEVRSESEKCWREEYFFHCSCLHSSRQSTLDNEKRMSGSNARTKVFLLSFSSLCRSSSIQVTQLTREPSENIRKYKLNLFFLPFTNSTVALWVRFDCFKSFVLSDLQALLSLSHFFYFFSFSCASFASCCALFFFAFEVWKVFNVCFFVDTHMSDLSIERINAMSSSYSCVRGQVGAERPPSIDWCILIIFSFVIYSPQLEISDALQCFCQRRMLRVAGCGGCYWCQVMLMLTLLGGKMKAKSSSSPPLALPDKQLVFSGESQTSLITFLSIWPSR